MQSSDPGHLFQTTQQIQQEVERQRKLKAAEKVGNPIKLSSKVLDLTVRGNEGWTGESGWQARRVDLRNGKTIKLYKGHKGPVTCVALWDVKDENTNTSWLALFTGSWDKTIKIWNADTGELVSTLEGHTDFIKSLTILPTTPPLLLSTSSDRTCRLWDISTLPPRSIQTVKEHTRPVECATYKYDTDENGRSVTGQGLNVWTGDSLGVIKRWKIKDGRMNYVEDVKGHETSVAQLALTDEGLWSVSMDKTAIFHPFSSSSRNIVPHPGYVKSILPLHEDFPIPHSYTLTGSEDEDIRIWEMEENKASLVGTIKGHCGEVSVMRAWLDGDSNEWGVVSGSLDGTIRRWTIKDILSPPELDYEPAPEPETPTGGMTEEEERELAELMSDED